jgi:hypothetical protein
MMYAKPWEHPSAVATLSVVILSALNQLFSSLHMLQSQEGDLVGHHLQFSNILERIS